MVMSDRDVKVEDDPRDIHDEGGDDEVRAGSFQDAPTFEPSTRFVRNVVLKSLETCHLKQY